MRRDPQGARVAPGAHAGFRCGPWAPGSWGWLGLAANSASTAPAHCMAYWPWRFLIYTPTRQAQQMAEAAGMPRPCALPVRLLRVGVLHRPLYCAGVVAFHGWVRIPRAVVRMRVEVRFSYTAVKPGRGCRCWVLSAGVQWAVTGHQLNRAKPRSYMAVICHTVLKY